MLSTGALAAATDLTLRDQFGATHGLRTDAQGLQLAIVVSAKRLRRIKPWEQALYGYDADLPVIRVADVPQTAPAEYEQVAAKLKKRLPEDVNVLIDLEGIWAATYGLDSSVPNILVFNGAGELQALHSGMYKGALFDALAADLDRLRAGSEPLEGGREPMERGSEPLEPGSEPLEPGSDQSP